MNIQNAAYEMGKGSKVRRKAWNPNRSIRMDEDDSIESLNENGQYVGEYNPTAQDVFETDWEVVE